VEDYIKNFPFPTKRERQSYVLNEIATAFASDYKYILLEAPTGFGNGAVAIAVARTLRQLRIYRPSTQGIFPSSR
jgi:Rad3-related DNA helicase